MLDWLHICFYKFNLRYLMSVKPVGDIQIIVLFQDDLLWSYLYPLSLVMVDICDL